MHLCDEVRKSDTVSSMYASAWLYDDEDRYVGCPFNFILGKQFMVTRLAGRILFHS